MLGGVAAFLGMLFAAWLIYQALAGHFPRAHVIFFILSALTGLYTFIFFLVLDISLFIRLAVAAVTGTALIITAFSIRKNRSR